MTASSPVNNRVIGPKDYELTDHLGNVRVVFTDYLTTTNFTLFNAKLRTVNDYYAFGMQMPGRGYNGEDYRYAFNGQEKDDEIKGSGNSYDYGFRIYDPRIGRPLSIDPLTKHYPELSPYQFFSNNPIWFIDLDGLEGLQYLETMKMKDGTTVTKRIVEVDIFVATSKNVKSIHYKSGDLPTIQSNLQSEYNKDFKDGSGNVVEFRFNIHEFDADVTMSFDKAKQLRRDPNNIVKSIDGTQAQKGFVLQKGKTKGGAQGITLGNLVTMSNKATDPSHTLAHETGHIFLNYDWLNNPIKPDDHERAGGIFKYKVVSEKGNTLSPIENVNQGNVNSILKSLPEIDSKTSEER